MLVKCWSGEQRDEYQSTSGSGNDGESDASDVNEGRTENLSNNNGKWSIYLIQFDRIISF